MDVGKPRDAETAVTQVSASSQTDAADSRVEAAPSGTLAWSLQLAVGLWVGWLGVLVTTLAHNREAPGAPTNDPATRAPATLRRLYPTFDARAERLEDLLALPDHSVTWHRSVAMGVLGALSCFLLLAFRDTHLGSTSPLTLALLVLVLTMTLMAVHFLFNQWMHANVLAPNAAEALALWGVTFGDLDVRALPSSPAQPPPSQPAAPPPMSTARLTSSATPRRTAASSPSQALPPPRAHGTPEPQGVA